MNAKLNFISPPAFLKRFPLSLRKSVILHGVLLTLLYLSSHQGNTLISDVTLDLKIDDSSGVNRTQKSASPPKTLRIVRSSAIPSEPETNDLSPNESANPQSDSVTGGTSSGPSNYFSELKSALNQMKEYPELARSRGIEGRVTVQFRILNDGSIDQVILSGNPAHPILSRAAVELIENLGRFKPLPAGLQTEEGLTITLPIDYILNPGR